MIHMFLDRGDGPKRLCEVDVVDFEGAVIGYEPYDHRGVPEPCDPCHQAYCDALEELPD